MNRAVSLVLLISGIILLIYGVSASESISSSFSRFFTGSPTDKTIWLLLGGAVAAVAYVRGDLDATLDAGFDQSLRAVNRAIDQLNYAKVSERKDTLQATAIARSAADKKIEFFVGRLTDKSTSLKIRVGTFGDETLQVSILEKVKSNV